MDRTNEYPTYTAIITSGLGNSAYVTLSQTLGCNKGQSISVSGHGTGVFVNLEGGKGTEFTVTVA